MKYKIVIFDLDGTILNTLEDLADSTNYALSVFDMPERTIEEIRHFVGNGIRKLMERAVPQGTPESMIVKVHETFTEHYKKHCADKTRPYDGIKELIENITSRFSRKQMSEKQAALDKISHGMPFPNKNILITLKSSTLTPKISTIVTMLNRFAGETVTIP